MGKAIQSDQQSGAPLHVFIVEDSQPVLERLEEMLSSIEGACFAGSAASVEAAISGILYTHPNAVILDIGLMHGSGFDVLRALRERRVGIPVYVLSNFATEPYRRLAEQLGACAFFDKTTQIDEMRELLTQRAAQHATLLH